MNQVAGEILDAAADADRGDRRGRLRAKAAAAGLLRPVDAPPVTADERARALDSVRGIGPVVDAELAADRDRR